jgi:hypothetical protein
MNLILEKTDQVKYFTNMKHVFSALGGICSEYDWYISDIEINRYIEGQFDESDKWMTGEQLNTLLLVYEIQFIWAVFSAFKKGKRVDITEIPYVYDNPNYWNGSEPSPQLDGAEFEIVCWDSSATILVGISEVRSSKFCSIYTDTVDLSSAAR